ncbi:NAD-dependent epimerase/dehydratase family protein [Staphylococcus aureus]
MLIDLNTTKNELRKRELFNHVLDILTRNKKKPAILLSSSIQATQDNPYGESKLQGEQLLRQYAEEYGNTVYIYRWPNLLGKSC